MSLNTNKNDLARVIDDDRPLISDSAATLISLFKQHMEYEPLAPAVIFRQETVTRINLWQQAASIARYLAENVGGKDHCVGLFVDPSVSLMSGAWGIMLSGNGFLPLSPEYPKERLRYMLEDSRTAVVFTQEHLRSQLEQLAPPEVHVFTEQDVKRYLARTASPITGREESTLSANTLAYVIYTSGSTGQPKGVMIEQRSIVNQMQWLAREYHLNAQTRILQKTPMSFDAAQWEILAPACGSIVIMGEPGIYKDPPRLIATIRRYRVTALQCVPTLLKAILDDDDILQCVTLKQIFSGGEVLHKRLATHCLETLPHCQLVNLYGPTECTINSSALTVSKEVLEKEPDMISIGRPIDNMRYSILDDTMRPVEAGETGELYISGVGLARGYLHRPEMTRERFLVDPFQTGNRSARMYKTGDLARWGANGTVNYSGRTDNQIKLRGYRIELDEIRAAIEKHDWVRNAAVIVKNDPHTGYQNLMSFVELNDKEATLMDQGNAESHHYSKANKAQVYMQLANTGCRDENENDRVISLPGSQETPQQRALAFGRKTYRHYEGGSISEQDLLAMLSEQPPLGQPAELSTLSLASLGTLLRYFGRFISDKRILPKYTWSSPGALYATQLYVELVGIAGLEKGIYYYHPVKHQLVFCSENLIDESPSFRCHFIGKKMAIAPIYKNNIEEVLNVEAGHMQGVLDYVLPGFGFSIAAQQACPEVKIHLGAADEDYYLTSCRIDSYRRNPPLPVDILVQAMPDKVAGLAAGLYHYQNNTFHFVSRQRVLKKHVIAINQKVYEDASFGIALLSRESTGWQKYVTLGRQMQHLMSNNQLVGLMASGYSSETGHDLPSATVLKRILSMRHGASYFCVGGRITEQQKQSEGMKEDIVHMKGPAEILRDDLVRFLPVYMVPNKIIVLEKLPQTANGKIDTQRLAAHKVELAHKTIVLPRSALEKQIAEIWQTCLKQPQYSIDDNFFEAGGNSLIAVAFLTRLNTTLNCHLPVQVIFTAPTIEKLALHIAANSSDTADISRLIPLQPRGRQTPVFCWPGLGGYCMNLRKLAVALSSTRPFYGIQASGINPGEAICPTIKEMAERDIQLIKQKQPQGPYVLWGYSFGARVAFEAAWQLECAGEHVKELILIAPGAPTVRQQSDALHAHDASFTNPTYLTILFSVFMGSIQHPMLAQCLSQVTTRDDFIDFIARHHEALVYEQIARITDIVGQTFEFTYSFHELNQRKIHAPVTVIKAQGDDYSFIESSDCFSVAPPNVITLKADHYQLLKESHIDELISAIG